MTHPLIERVEARVRAAEATGAFDDLPGAGKPLPRCDDPENAVLNRIIKESGAVPDIVAVSPEMARLRAALRNAAAPAERRVRGADRAGAARLTGQQPPSGLAQNSS